MNLRSHVHPDLAESMTVRAGLERTGGARLCAVVIEDDPEIRAIHRQVLEQMGLDTVVTTNASDGVDAVRTFAPAVTILDVTMTGMDGVAAARGIRDFSDTHIIMVSALNDEIDVVQGLNAGADDYVLKPFRPRELRARVEAVLRRRRTMVATSSVTAPEPGLWTREPSPTDGVTPVPTSSVRPPGLAVVTPVEATPGPAAPVPSTDVAVAIEPEDDSGWTHHNGLAVHVGAGRAQVDGVDVELAHDELVLLTALMDSAPRVRSTANLVLALRGEGYVTTYFVNDADKRVVREHMDNLRRKLGDTGQTPTWIESVSGVGYRMTSV